MNNLQQNFSGEQFLHFTKLLSVTRTLAWPPPIVRKTAKISHVFGIIHQIAPVSPSLALSVHRNIVQCCGDIFL